MNDLFTNPYWNAEILYKNMEAFGKEGLLYLETENGINGLLTPGWHGVLAGRGGGHPARAPCSAGRRRRPASKCGSRTRCCVSRRMRKTQVRAYYAINDAYRDLFVGVNFVGREDDDKGYPLRFLTTLRELRHKYPDINLSIHAGEVDEPNQHVRDTLLLGAKRIGHGVNLITDPDTMLLHAAWTLPGRDQPDLEPAARST